MNTRHLRGAALALMLASPVLGQEPTPPTSEPAEPMMQMMMGCMSAHSGMHMPGMMGGMNPASGMQGQGMRGMADGPMGGANSPMGACPGCAAEDAVAALLGRPVAGLTLTEQQRTELDALVARARSDALGLLTPEQRETLESQPPAPGGMCMAAPTSPDAEHQH